MKRVFSRFGLVLAIVALALVIVPSAIAQVPALGPITVTFTNSSGAATICNVTAQNSGSFYMIGTMGPVDAQASVDGVTWSTTNIITTAGAVQAQPFTPTIGILYQVAPLPGGCVRVIADSSWTNQNATVIMRAQGALANFPAATVTLASLPPVTIAAPTDASGNVKVAAQNTAPAAALPTASAGAAPPASTIQTNSYDNCFVPAGATPNVTGGNSITLQCQPNGALVVATPQATPLATASPGLQPLGQVPFVGAYMHCQFPAGNVPNVTIGRSIAVQCDSGGRLQTTTGALGSSGVYQSNQCDTFATSASIVTAVATKLISNSAGKPTYICLATFENTGTNGTNTIQYQWGTKTTNECDTGTNTLFPAAVAPGTATGEWLNGWAGGNVALATANGMPPPASQPLIIPAGQDFCGVTAGTTTAGKFVVFYAQH